MAAACLDAQAPPETQASCQSSGVVEVSTEGTDGSGSSSGVVVLASEETVS